MAKKTLSKGGRTSFIVENIDWPFIMEALEKYKTYVDEAEFPEHSLVTKRFVQDRVVSLIDTFTVMGSKEGGGDGDS